MTKKRFAVVTAISFALSLLSGLIRQPQLERLDGGSACYGIPVGWRWVNTSVYPAESEWSMYSLIINAAVIFLVVAAITLAVTHYTGEKKNAGKNS